VRTCSACGKENPDINAFCGQCGAPLVPRDVPRFDAASSAELLREVMGDGNLDPGRYEYPGDAEGVQRLKSLRLDTIVKFYIKYWTGPQGMATLLGNAVEITGKQFPDLHALAEHAASNLRMQVPRVFIIQEPSMNAATYGVDQDNFVMLTSALVDNLKPEEIVHTLGHEFGHIKSNHVLYLNAANWAISGAIALLGMIVAGPVGLIVGPAFRMALNDWSRKAEFTADRAGLLATRDLNASVLSLAKITLGSRSLMEKIDLEAFMEQLEEKAAVDYGFVELFQSHPFMPKRVKELHDFYKAEYRSIVLDVPGL
jgi:Zn-dependent protease with chaperone function